MHVHCTVDWKVSSLKYFSGYLHVHVQWRNLNRWKFFKPNKTQVKISTVCLATEIKFAKNLTGEKFPLYSISTCTMHLYCTCTCIVYVYRYTCTCDIKRSCTYTWSLCQLRLCSSCGEETRERYKKSLSVCHLFSSLFLYSGTTLVRRLACTLPGLGFTRPGWWLLPSLESSSWFVASSHSAWILMKSRRSLPLSLSQSNLVSLLLQSWDLWNPQSWILLHVPTLWWNLWLLVLPNCVWLHSSSFAVWLCWYCGICWYHGSLGWVDTMRREKNVTFLSSYHLQLCCFWSFGSVANTSCSMSGTHLAMRLLRYVHVHTCTIMCTVHNIHCRFVCVWTYMYMYIHCTCTCVQ